MCTIWAYLVVHTNPGDDVQAWLGRFFPPDAPLSPIDGLNDTFRHRAMNFSRCWGFWAVYKATKDPKYLRLFLDHFELQYRTPAAWKGDYRVVAHWVAQFGVFALVQTFLE